MIKYIITIFLSLYFCNFGLAQDNTQNKTQDKTPNTSQNTSNDRWIDLDWESVQGAKSYEIELFEFKDRSSLSRGVFKSEVPRWTMAVPPGKYAVKIRSLDSRDVGGEWSEQIPVSVKLPKPLLLSPKSDEVFESRDGANKEITFQWEGSSGANYYRLNIFDQENVKFFTVITPLKEYKTNFFKLQNYSWEVLPLYEESESSEEGANEDRHTFTLVGGELKAPKLRTSISTNDIIVNWSKVENAEFYSYKLIQDKDGQKVAVEGKTSKLGIFVPKNKLSKGVLIIQISSSAKGFRNSDWNEAIYEYDLKTIKLIQESDIAEKLKSNNSLAIFVSAPRFDYKVKNFTTDTKSSETVRGYNLELAWKNKLNFENTSNDLWYSANLDFSSIADSYTSGFIARSNHILLKNYSWSRFSMRPSLGLSLFRAPALNADRSSGNKILDGNYFTIGTVLGTSFSFDLSSKYNLSFSPTISYHALALSTPNDEKFKSSLGIDADMKLSYKFLKNIDLSLRGHFLSHEFKSQAITGGTSMALLGDINSSKIKSFYLLIGSEWNY